MSRAGCGSRMNAGAALTERARPWSRSGGGHGCGNLLRSSPSQVIGNWPSWSHGHCPPGLPPGGEQTRRGAGQRRAGGTWGMAAKRRAFGVSGRGPVSKNNTERS